jgi:hypothetical protein
MIPWGGSDGTPRVPKDKSTEPPPEVCPEGEDSHQDGAIPVLWVICWVAAVVIVFLLLPKPVAQLIFTLVRVFGR